MSVQVTLALILSPSGGMEDTASLNFVGLRGRIGSSPFSDISQ